jgi:hypothetical protein
MKRSFRKSRSPTGTREAADIPGISYQATTGKDTAVWKDLASVVVNFGGCELARVLCFYSYKLQEFNESNYQLKPMYGH